VRSGGPHCPTRFQVCTCQRYDGDLKIHCKKLKLSSGLYFKVCFESVLIAHSLLHSAACGSDSFEILPKCLKRLRFVTDFFSLVDEFEEQQQISIQAHRPFHRPNIRAYQMDPIFRIR